MRYGDDHVEDDDTDKYDGFETLCRGASDRLGLGWRNRQPNTWAWHVRCRTHFPICCCQTGGAHLLIVVQAYFYAHQLQDQDIQDQMF